MLISQRHDLLFLSAKGRELARQNGEPGPEWVERCWTEYPTVPAICTGRTAADDPNLLRVGFSYPLRKNGVRCRLAAYLPVQTITRTVTPWEAARSGRPLKGPFEDCFHRLRTAARNAGIPFGLFGSSALARVTGLPYLYKDSDLDILLGAAPPGLLEPFVRTLDDVQRDTGIRIDGELRIDHRQFVKFRELFQDRKTVLVKGGPEPQLLSRRAIWDMLSGG